MLFIGRLSQDKRGVGSIIGAVFLILILLSGYAFYALNFNVTRDYTEILQDMQQLDLERNKENIEFVIVSFNLNKLNLTVKNIGSCQSHLIWLGIFNETVTPNSQDYYQIDFYVNPAETITNVGNDTIPSFEGEERIIQIVTDYGNTYSVSYPEKTESGSESDYVDVEGAPPTIGNHSFFEGQKAGPDGIIDKLTEGIYDQEKWMSPTGYEDPGNEWISETNAYDENTGTYAQDVIQPNSWSNYLVLTINSTMCQKIQYYIGRQSGNINQVQIDIYNSTWFNVYSGAGTWGAWANVSFMETSVTKMRFRLFNSHSSQQRNAFVYEADFLRSLTLNYRLDLEVQWTNADYNEANEWLCIYGANISSEDLRVDVWNGASWVTIIPQLKSGWNSVDISSYLSSSTFKIRFRDTMQTGDIIQDIWEIDTAFLYVWTEGA